MRWKELNKIYDKDVTVYERKVAAINAIRAYIFQNLDVKLTVRHAEPQLYRER
jgi:hypothetical protein